MADTDKIAKPKLQLDNLPDWIKVLVFALASFGAAGGGSQVFGKDYTAQFDKLDGRLQKIEHNASTDHERMIRLEFEVDNLKKSAK